MNLLISFLDYLWIFWLSHIIFLRRDYIMSEIWMLGHFTCSVFLMAGTFHNIALYLPSIFVILFSMMIFYKESWSSKLHAILLYIFLCVFSRILGSLLTHSFISLVNENRIINITSKSIEIILYESVLFLIILLLIHRVRLFQFTRVSSILIIIILMIGIIERAIRFYHIEHILQSSPVIHLIMNLMILLVCFILFILIQHFGTLNNLHFEHRILLAQYAEREIYYREVEVHNEQLQKIKHDFKNQLIALRGMVHHENEPCLEEIDLLIEDCNTTGVLYSRHQGFQNILKQKFKEAELLGIEVTHNICIPKNIRILGIEAASLIGNLLDNAIEGCIFSTAEDRKIILHISIEKGCLFLYIRNNTHLDNTKCISIKNDNKNHGYGIRNIRSVVNKYHGTMEMDIIEGFFETKIMLCDVL